MFQAWINQKSDVKGQVDPDKRSDRNIEKMILYKWKIDEKYWKFDWRYIAARKVSTCTRLEFNSDSEFQKLFQFFKFGHRFYGLYHFLWISGLIWNIEAQNLWKLSWFEVSLKYGYVCKWIWNRGTHLKQNLSYKKKQSM